MLLTEQGVAEIRQLMADHRSNALARFEVQQITLAGMLELAYCAYESRNDAAPDRVKFLRQMRRRFPLLDRGVALLETSRFTSQTRQEDLFTAPEVDVAPAHSGWLAGDNSQLFLQRFARTVRQQGYGERFPYAFAGAFVKWPTTWSNTVPPMTTYVPLR